MEGGGSGYLFVEDHILLVRRHVLGARRERHAPRDRPQFRPPLNIARLNLAGTFVVLVRGSTELIGQHIPALEYLRDLAKLFRE